MWLTVVGMTIAGASAVFAIWSVKDLEVLKASIATALTLAGILVGLVSAYSDSRSRAQDARVEAERHDRVVANLERQREEALNRERMTQVQFRALQTSLPLHSLEIVWHIPDPPQELVDAIDLSTSIFETYVVSDDEFSRWLSRTDYGVLQASYAVDNAIPTILAALADGTLNARKFFGDDAEEVAAFWREPPRNFDPLDAPVASSPGEIDVVFLLPLNLDHSGVLSVGRKADDPRPQELRERGDTYDGYWNDLAQAKGYGFKAGVGLDSDGLQLWFLYERQSLEQASRLLPGQILTIAWPDAFSLIVVPKGFPENGNYLTELREGLGPANSSGKGLSTLTLIPNGLREAAIVFDVGMGEPTAKRTDISTYYDDINEDIFPYTRFPVRRKV